MKNNLYLDINVIQTMPPSNVNRDDTGSPKTAQYGGVRRARISSQSLKRAMRKYFLENGADIGIRSLRIPDYIADKIQDLDASIQREDAVKMAVDVLKKAKISTRKKDGTVKVKALFFISNTQASMLAKAAIEGVGERDVLAKIIKEKPSVDIALFGRMVASDTSLNEEASSQVAHAISTHEVRNEFDFYTAVDELNVGDDSGAGMLGTTEYNSSTLYKYGNVAVHDFYSKLDNDKEMTIEALKLFIKSFILSMPTGKINSYANQTLPQAVIVSIRKDRPVNLVGAFEKPIKSKDGYVDESVNKMFEEFVSASEYVEEPEFTAYLSKINNVENIGEKSKSLNDLLDRFECYLGKIID